MTMAMMIVTMMNDPLFMLVESATFVLLISQFLNQAAEEAEKQNESGTGRRWIEFKFKFTLWHTISSICVRQLFSHSVTWLEAKIRFRM